MREHSIGIPVNQIPFLGEYYFLVDKLNWCSPTWPEIGISDSGFLGVCVQCYLLTIFFLREKVCFFSLNVLKDQHTSLLKYSYFHYRLDFMRYASLCQHYAVNS